MSKQAREADFPQLHQDLQVCGSTFFFMRLEQESRLRKVKDGTEELQAQESALACTGWRRGM